LPPACRGEIIEHRRARVFVVVYFHGKQNAFGLGPALSAGNRQLPIGEGVGLARVLYTPMERKSNQNFLADVAYKGDES
jgi:hypothetical protein